MSRIDPITAAEWGRIRTQLRGVVRDKAFTEAMWDWAERAYGAVMDALWETGCHPSVLADPAANSATLKQTSKGWNLQWRRPKTRRICVMPISGDLAERLKTYMALPGHYSTRSILRMVRECADRAGIPDVTPKTLRHSVAFDLFKRHGPSVVMESLGVSQKVLNDYMAMSAETRVEAIRQGRQNA